VLQKALTLDDITTSGREFQGLTTLNK